MAHVSAESTTPRGNDGPRVIVTDQCSCISCNKGILWLMRLIMEEAVHGWQAVGSRKGYGDGGEDGAGRRKASEQEGRR